MSRLDPPQAGRATARPPQERRCGPWIEEKGGTHRCQKCGRLDPLDFMEDNDNE